MERIKQILTDNVSYITVTELNDLLERKDNLNPQESFMLGVNVGRMVEHAVNSEYYCDSDKIWVLHSFIEAMKQEKPAVIKKDIKDTIREYIEEIYNRAETYKKYDNTDVSTRLYNVGTELKELLRDFENSAEVKNALIQTEKEIITENHRLTKYP